MTFQFAGTPGRVMHMIKAGALETDKLKILVLDEVDVMLSRGFEQQIINAFPVNKTIYYAYIGQRYIHGAKESQFAMHYCLCYSS